jgi:hypothetical protein
MEYILEAPINKKNLIFIPDIIIFTVDTVAAKSVWSRSLSELQWLKGLSLVARMSWKKLALLDRIWSSPY